MKQNYKKWKRDKTYTKLEHNVYCNPLPKKPKNKENYCVITFSEGGTVAVIALTDKDEILLLEQYRPAVDRWVVNLPGGRVDGKDEKKQINKELKEETGFTSKEFKEIYDGKLFQNPTRITDKTTIFLAKKIIKKGKPTSSEITEKNTKVLKVKLSDIKKLLSGESQRIKANFLWPRDWRKRNRYLKRENICDMTTVAALSLFFLNSN